MLKKEGNLDWWKESLKCNGQQFYQYQQNKQSPLTLTHWTPQIPYDVGNPCTNLGHAQKCGGIKSVYRIPIALNARGVNNELSHAECFWFVISSFIAEG